MPDFDVLKAIRGLPDWEHGRDLWDWLLDSLEGGTDYIEAEYPGWAARGLPGRNLVRHKHEEPVPDARGVLRENPDFALRRARTPVPAFVETILEAHLSAIYEQPVRRETSEGDAEPASPLLEDWWGGGLGGVDGAGTAMREWVPQEFAPYFLALGFLDVLAAAPAAPADRPVVSRADVRRGNLDGCVLRVCFPQRIPWWEREPGTDLYRRVLVHETLSDGAAGYRLWTAEDWTLYDRQGRTVETQPHPYRRVPVQRLFLRRRSRRRWVGTSIYEAIAARQRSAYNVWSEVELANALNAHPIAQGPERDCDPTPDEHGNVPAIPWGPGRALPKRIVRADNGTIFEQDYSYVEAPPSPVETLLKCYDRLADEADKIGRITKPAGSTGTSASTTRQTAESKSIDERGGMRLLAGFAAKLAEAEWAIGALVASVLHRGNPPPRLAKDLTVVYPTRFNLRSGTEIAELATEYQAVVENSGRSPEVEKRFARAIVRDAFPGLDDAKYAELEADADAAIDLQAERVVQANEGVPALSSITGGVDGQG